MLVQKEDLVEVLEYLDKQEKLACDTETTGLRFHDRLFSVQFASQDRSFYLDKRVLGEGFRHIKSLFDRERTWLFQNAKFDMRMLHWEGMHPKGTIIDLEVLVRLDRNDVMSTRLADTARREGLEKLDIVEKYMKEHKLKGFDQVPVEIMSQYAHHDARITYDLSEKLLSRLDPRCTNVYENECRLTPICHEMEMNGALIDQEYTNKMLNYESGLIREAMHKFLLVTGSHYSTSKKFLVEIFTKAGETIPLTAKGNYSLDEEALDSFTSPAARIMQEVRFYEKRISTYYSSFLELCDGDGLIHPDMRQAGTKTGRFSYRDPNLQNIPKEDSKEDLTRPNLVRRCFIPEKDHVLVSMDYAQQEYRLMLAYADQRDLIEKVMAGMDLHEATAQMVGISRKHAKTLNFAILYGAGDEKLAGMLGISEQEATLMRKRYFMALPMVMHFTSKVKRTVTSRGHIYNWLGRKIHLPGGIPSAAYAVPNHLIQGGGADVCKRAMVEVHPEIKGTGIKMQKQVHDQLLFQVPKDQFDKLPRIQEIMESTFPEKNGMRMKVDVSWSDRSFAEADMKKGFPHAPSTT